MSLGTLRYRVQNVTIVPILDHFAALGLNLLSCRNCNLSPLQQRQLVPIRKATGTRALCSFEGDSTAKVRTSFSFRVLVRYLYRHGALQYGYNWVGMLRVRYLLGEVINPCLKQHLLVG